jgi:hypothetical protein
MLYFRGLFVVNFLQARAVAQDIGRRGAEAVEVFVAVGVDKVVAPAFDQRYTEKAGVVRPPDVLPQFGKYLPRRGPGYLRGVALIFDFFVGNDFIGSLLVKSRRRAPAFEKFS